MAGGSTRELRRALEETAAAQPEAAGPARNDAGVEIEPIVAAEGGSGEPDTAALLATLADAADRAAQTFAVSPAEFRAAAEAIRVALVGLESALEPSTDLACDAPPATGGGTPPEDAPREIRLPTGRHPYALAVGTTDVDPALLARCAGVDLSTARAAVAAGGVRVLVRAADRAELMRRLTNVHAAGLRGAVVDASTLRAYGPATSVVAVGEGVRIVTTPLWESVVDPYALPRGEPAALGEPWLLVVGEVEEHRLAVEAETSRWQRTRYAAGSGTAAEARAFVLDLHTPAAIFRVREGACDWRELPGFDPASQRRSMRTFVDTLVARWPAMHVEPRRVCAAQARPGESRATGWAAWEEHSRVCRVVWGQAG